MKNHLRLVSNNNKTERQFQRSRAREVLGSSALAALRYGVYLVLLFLRIPIQIISRLTVVPLLFFAVIWGGLKGWMSTPTLLMAGAAFAMFVCSFLYDKILLRVAPEPIRLPM